MGYLVGYHSYLLLLQGLANLYEAIGVTMLNGCIQVAHSAYSQNFLPFMVLLEYIEHLVLTDESTQLCRIVARGYAQQDTIIVILQTKQV